MDSLLNAKRIFGLIDERTKCLINGYIRELEREMQSTQRNVNCPQEINDLCVLFAHTPPEQFAEFSDGIILSSDDHPFGLKNQALLNSDVDDYVWYTVIGEYKANCGGKMNMVYEWTILVATSTVSIGIMSTTNDWDSEYYPFTGSGVSTYYALSNTGGLEYRDDNIAVQQKSKCGVHSIEEGDVIKMTLDAGQRALSFVKNGHDLDVGYKMIDDGQTYNLAVSCVKGRSDDHFVKLMNFCILYDS